MAEEREERDQATIALSAEQRAALGLPPLNEPIQPTTLPALTVAQWADPRAVSARLALLQTNYWAHEEPVVLMARWRPYLVPRFAEDLAASPSDGPAPAELLGLNAVSVGEILGLALSERFSDRAVVSLTARRNVVLAGRSIRAPRVVIWVLTLVFDAATNRWLVAGIERS